MAACPTPTASSSSTRAACTARRSGPAAWPASKACRTPSLVAQKVMDFTDHHLLVGKDAQAFARNFGFTIEADLNTERSRAAWLEWKRRSRPVHYLDPIKREAALRRIDRDMMAEGWVDPKHFYGTINCNGINAGGRHLRRHDDERAGVEDSGPRRRLADPRRRALRRRRGRRRRFDRARRGQSLQPCSYQIVEEMRRGRSPKDAGMEALKRIQANTVEKRLLNSRGLPNFDINFYMLNAKGEHAGVTLYGGNVQVRGVHRERRRARRLRRAARGAVDRLTRKVRVRGFEQFERFDRSAVRRFASLTSRTRTRADRRTLEPCTPNLDLEPSTPSNVAPSNRRTSNPPNPRTLRTCRTLDPIIPLTHS